MCSTLYLTTRWPQPVLTIIGVLLVAAVAGCAPTASPESADATDNNTAEHAAPPRRQVPLRPDLPPPPGVDNGRLTRHTGEALDKARRSLDDILTALPAPSAWPDTPGEGPAQREDPPPLKAVQTYTVARAAYEDRQPDRAARLLEQVIQLDPHSAEAHRLLGQIRVEQNAHDQAREHLNRALALRPGDPATLYQLGRLAFATGQWVDAVAGIGHALQHDPDAIEPALAHLAVYQLGMALLEAGYEAAGIEQLESFLAERRRFDRSSRYLRHMAVLAQREPAVHARIGDAAVRLGRYADADDHYARVLDAPDVNDHAMLPRAILCDLVFGRDATATDRLLSLDWSAPPEDAAALVRYVADHHRDRAGLVRRFLAKADEPAAAPALALATVGLLPDRRAETYLTGHVARAPENGELFTALVERLIRRDPPAAVARTAELIGEHPNHARSLVSRLLAAAGESVDLMMWLDRLDAGPAPAVVLYMRGAVQQQAGNVERAERAYAVALQADADFTPARLAAIELKVASRQYEQALRMIEETDAPGNARLRLLQVIALDALGRHQQALDRINALVADQPNNLEFLLRKSVLLERTGKFTEAEAVIGRMLEIDPTYEAAYALGFRLFRNEAPDARKFLLLLRKLQGVRPHSRLARYQTAYLHVVRSELDRAEAIYRSLLETGPPDPAVLRDLVALLGRASRWDEAQTLLIESIEEDADNAALLDLLRQVTARTGDREPFFTRFERYLQQQDDSATKFLRLAGLYYDWHRLDPAIDAQRRAMAMDEPQRLPEHRVRLAELLREAGRHDEALAEIDRAIDAQPDRAVLYRVKSRILTALERGLDAVQVLREAIDRQTDDPLSLRIELAGAYAQIDQLAAGIEQLDRAIADAPNRAAELHYRKSHLSMRAGRPDRAEDALKAALAVDPNFAPANNDLGYTWADRGEHLHEAREMIQKAVAAQPDNAAYLDSMGWVMYKLGEFAPAVKLLARATELPGGNDPVLFDHLGDALWRGGERERAAAQWRAAMEVLAERSDGMHRDDVKLKAAIEAKLHAVEQGEPPDVAEVPEPAPPDAADDDSPEAPAAAPG